MPYEKTIWKSKDLISAQKMNKIEDGIASAVSLVEGLDNLYDIFPTKRATGNVVTCSSCMKNVPIKSLNITIEPQQDLHGYDSPWIGGTRKNLLVPTPRTETVNGITYTIHEDGTITLSGTATDQVKIVLYDVNTAESPLGTPGNTYVCQYEQPNTTSIDGFSCWIEYDLKYSLLNDSSIIPMTHQAGNSFVQATIESNENYITWFSQIYLSISKGEKISSNKNRIYPMVCLKSSDTTYEPYANICPINPINNEITITQCGKNLFNPSYTIIPGRITGNEISNPYYLYPPAYYVCCEDYIKVNPETDYVFSGQLIATNHYNGIAFYNKEQKFLKNYTPQLGTLAQFTTPSNCHYIRFNAGQDAFDASTVQLEQNTIATTYEPYQSQTYTINIPNNKIPIYGGILDPIKGIFTSTYGVINNYNGEQLTGKWLSDRDAYIEDTLPSIGAQVVYELETPIIINFTSITITALNKIINIYPNIGNIDVIYRTEFQEGGSVDTSLIEEAITKSETAQTTALRAQSDATSAKTTASNAETLAQSSNNQSTALQLSLNNITDILKGNKTEFNFSSIGTSSYPLGWRTGYYDANGAANSSHLYIRTLPIPNTLLNNTKIVTVTPPSDYYCWINVYNQDGSHDTRYGTNNSGQPQGLPITFLLNTGQTFGISLGFFSNADAASHLTADFINTIKCELFAQPSSSTVLSASYDNATKTLTLIGSSQEGGSSEVSYDFIVETPATTFADAQASLFPDITSISQPMILYVLANKKKSKYPAYQIVAGIACPSDDSGFARYSDGQYRISTKEANWLTGITETGDGFNVILTLNDGVLKASAESGIETEYTAQAASTLADAVLTNTFGTNFSGQTGLYFARYIGDVSAAPNQKVVGILFTGDESVDAGTRGFIVRRTGTNQYQARPFDSNYGAIISQGDRFAVRKIMD